MNHCCQKRLPITSTSIWLCSHCFMSSACSTFCINVEYFGIKFWWVTHKIAGHTKASVGCFGLCLAHISAVSAFLWERTLVACIAQFKGYSHLLCCSLFIHCLRSIACKFCYFLHSALSKLQNLREELNMTLPATARHPDLGQMAQVWLSKLKCLKCDF